MLTSPEVKDAPVSLSVCGKSAYLLLSCDEEIQ